MKRTLSVIAGALLLAGNSGGATAADAAKAEVLAKQHNCLQCHSADKKIIGPSYKEVAAKYKGKPDASAVLAKSIKGGAKGSWGPVPMPANDKVPDGDIGILVNWILSM